MKNRPFYHKKNLGQHFLKDQAVIANILACIAVQPGEHLIEIGPGQGALTLPLLQRPLSRLDVIELDRTLLPFWEKQASHYPALHVHHADVLRFDLLSILEKNEKIRLLGNLPYQISTPLFFHLLQYQAHVYEMIFMVQREVAERMTAVPHSKAYGRLSVMLQCHYEIDLLFLVMPTAFYPPPAVDSAMIRMKLREKSTLPAIEDPAIFEKLVAHCFNHRRKILKKILKLGFGEALLTRSSAFEHLEKRPEALTVRDFITLANLLCHDSV